MRCIHISKRNVFFILLSLIFNNLQLTHLADNMMDLPDTTTKGLQQEKKLIKDNVALYSVVDEFSATSDLTCPEKTECSKLKSVCIKCDFDDNCIYGSETNVTCQALKHVKCKEPRTFKKTFICRYCYQTDPWEHNCELKASCNSASTPRAYYRSNCTVKPRILCLGNRKFLKNIPCNWTVGYRWSTALILSITLGGFGADRFYLGHWQEGIGKLFSFGGLGVWTLVDVVLISLHYLGPADGSLYI